MYIKALTIPTKPCFIEIITAPKQPIIPLKKNILVVGNPGAGKSTLLNTILQNVYFKSGSSIGSGLTFQLDCKEVNGVTYMDTPGLIDISKRKAAAEAITKALRQEGHYRVIVVVTLEQGRLRPDDVSLLKLVLESAVQLTSYSLVLNQVSKAVQKKLTNDQAIYQMLMEGGIENKHFSNILGL